MELNLSPSSTQVNDKYRSTDVKVSRPVEELDETGGEKAPAEADTLDLRAAARDGDEEQSRKSAVDSDTGQNIDISV